MVCAFTVSPLWADKVYLKSGQVVEGKIYEQSSYAVKMMVNQMPKMFYQNEIDRVEKSEDSPNVEPKEYESGKMNFKDIPEERRALVKRLLEANGARESLAMYFSQIAKQAPEEARSKIKDMLNIDEIILRITPVYTYYYTDEEIREMIRFYSGPTGKKLLQLTPAIMEKTLEEAGNYFQEYLSQTTPAAPTQATE